MIFGRCCSRIGEQGQGDQRVRNAKNYATSLRLRGHVAPFCFLRTHRATRSLTAEVAGGFSHCGVRDRASCADAGVQSVRRYDWDEAQLKATNGQKIADLPGSGGGHSTRTIIFWNGKMYVAAGSSCNVCKEDDPRRAAVTEYNEDGSGQRLFASGLRNS